MSRSQPPAIAAWLLEHLTRRTANDALAGDILEEYRGGRSAAWFCRQVLLAILARVANALRRASFALSFALCWTIVTILWGHYFFPSQIQKTILQWWADFQWPWSTILYISIRSALTSIPVVVGMSLYIVVSRRFSPRRYFVAVMLAFVRQVATLVLPGITGHDRTSWTAIFFATLLLIILVAQGAKRDESRIRGPIVE